MKMYRSLLTVLFLIAVSSLAVFAQPNRTQPQPTAAFKIGLIDTAAFEDEKAGIAKYISGMKSVDVIFKKELDDLGAMVPKIQTLEKELTEMQTRLNAQVNPAVPINRAQLQTSYNTKLEEYEKMGREYKFKQDDLKIRYQRRQQEIMGPIMQDIGTAIREFAKKNGYTVIFDTAKLADLGALLAIGDEKIDLTKDFIAFYNTRPAPTPTK